MADLSTKQCVQDRYDETSPEKAKKYRNPYWRFYYQHSFGHFISKQVNELEKEVNKDRLRILDIGTGAGLYSYILRGESREIIGIDISTTAVRTADQELGDVASFMIGDGEQLGIKSDSIDVVVSMGTFEYIDDLNPVLSEISRVLCSSGYLLFSAHNSGSLQNRDTNLNDAPIAEHSRSDLVSALDRQDFQIEYAKTVFSVPSLFKQGFMSERVLSIIRWIVLLISVIVEQTAETLPYIRRYGGFWLVLAKKKSRSRASTFT